MTALRIVRFGFARDGDPWGRGNYHCLQCGGDSRTCSCAVATAQAACEWADMLLAAGEPVSPLPNGGARCSACGATLAPWPHGLALKWRHA